MRPNPQKAEPRTPRQEISSITLPTCVLLGVLFGGLIGESAPAGLRPGSGESRPTSKAEGPTLVAIQDIARQGLRRSDFYLPRTTELVVKSVGYSDDGAESYSAYGWILDLASREPVWSLPEHDAEEDDDGNWRAEDRISLPPGAYTVYYAAYGGTGAFEYEFKLGDIVLGKVKTKRGPHRDWDAEGDPDAWGIWVTAVDKGFQPASFPSVRPQPFPDAVFRQIGLRDSERRRAVIELARDVALEVRATGEYSQSEDDFVDGAWILDLDRGRRVFELDIDDTEDAGGHLRNRLYQGTLRLRAGHYRVTVGADDSHAFDAWNSPPPWDPESWGLVLSLEDPSDRDAVKVIPTDNLPPAAVELVRVQDNETRCQSFRVERPTRVLVRALGEAAKEDQYADFGWIEDRRSFEAVWQMDTIPSMPAGGAAKNREVESLIVLPAGSYNLCYAADDSHAYSDWNQAAPSEPEMWGIRLFALDPASKGALVIGDRGEAPTTISVAPIGSDEHVSRPFGSDGSTHVRIIAIGEGDEDELFDFGWIENAETGRIVWEMDPEECEWAGGAQKNVEIRTELTLPPGRYEVHYETDGSHAFGDWNAPPPRQPHLWGITLIELDD